MSIPVAGGSYVRKPDGTLQRVAFTDTRPQAPAPAPPPAAEARRSARGPGRHPQDQRERLSHGRAAALGEQGSPDQDRGHLRHRCRPHRGRTRCW